MISNDKLEIVSKVPSALWAIQFKNKTEQETIQVNVAELAQELLDARQKIAKLIDLFDKTADHHCSGMCGHDDVLKKKGILTHDEWVKYADEVMREVENANKN